MIYVLHESPHVRDAVRAALEEVGPVRATGLWSEIPGNLIGGESDDVLVTDLHMRAISGVRLVEIVRRYHPEVRVVFYTATPEEVPAGLADAVVRKQRGLERLKATVRRLVPGLAKAKSSGRLRIPELLRDDSGSDSGITQYDSGVFRRVV